MNPRAPAEAPSAATLCLNMIVRNEAAIIEKCLESVAPCIACWSILDTGSTDDTPALIEQFFSARGIPGALHHGRFVDFALTRNRALDLCRQSGLAFDYILLIDADMELVTGQAVWPGPLDRPVYSIRQQGGLVYDNVRLLRRDCPATYRGVTHEYLDSTGETVRLESAHMLDHACGANRPGKSQRDIRLLRRGLEEEPDNARYLFYLAQSLRDAGEFGEAYQCYLLRTEAGGWAEETWYSRYQAARCLLNTGREAEGIATALQAWQERPGRAEPLALISTHYRENGSHHLCCEFAGIGLRIPFPLQDRLFVEPDVYHWRFRQELSIASFYTGDPAYRQLGSQCCHQLAEDADVPAKVREAARRNLRFYARSAEDWLELRIVAGFNPPGPEGWPGFNPSLWLDHGHRALILRQANYVLADGQYRSLDKDGVIRTNNYFVPLDGDLRPTMMQPMLVSETLQRPGRAPRFPFPVEGYEDCRLIRWRDRWWVSATVRDTTAAGICEIVLLELDEEARIVGETLLRGSFSDRHQKNWMPFVHNDELHFVYSLSPTVVLRYDPSRQQVVEVSALETEGAYEHLRGGGQLLFTDRGFLGICHESIRSDSGSAHYLHRFFLLDREFRLVAVSDVFSFTGSGVEFCAGIALEVGGDSLLLSFGVNDSEAFLGRVSLERVMRSLRGTVQAVR